MDLFRWVIISFLLLSFLFFNNASAKPQASIFEREQRDLLNYMDKVLVEAGVPNDIRGYLVNASRSELAKVDKNNFQQKKALLKMNLYILLIDLAAKKPLLLNQNTAAFSSEMNRSILVQFLSSEHLGFLKSNQTFNELKLTDVKIIFSSICPMWPWC